MLICFIHTVGNIIRICTDKLFLKKLKNERDEKIHEIPITAILKTGTLTQKCSYGENKLF